MLEGWHWDVGVKIKELNEITKKRLKRQLRMELKGIGHTPRTGTEDVSHQRVRMAVREVGGKSTFP